MRAQGFGMIVVLVRDMMDQDNAYQNTQNAGQPPPAKPNSLWRRRVPRLLKFVNSSCPAEQLLFCSWR
jgi:hypothetical protein